MENFVTYWPVVGIYFYFNTVVIQIVIIIPLLCLNL